MSNDLVMITVREAQSKKIVYGQFVYDPHWHQDGPLPDLDAAVREYFNEWCSQCVITNDDRLKRPIPFAFEGHLADVAEDSSSPKYTIAVERHPHDGGAGKSAWIYRDIHHKVWAPARAAHGRGTTTQQSEKSSAMLTFWRACATTLGSIALSITLVSLIKALISSPSDNQ